MRLRVILRDEYKFRKYAEYAEDIERCAMDGLRGFWKIDFVGKFLSEVLESVQSIEANFRRVFLVGGQDFPFDAFDAMRQLCSRKFFAPQTTVITSFFQGGLIGAKLGNQETHHQPPSRVMNSFQGWTLHIIYRPWGWGCWVWLSCFKTPMMIWVVFMLWILYEFFSLCCVFFSNSHIFTIFVFFQIYVDDSACINKRWHKAAGIDDCFVVATKGEFTLPETNSSHLSWMTSISFWVSAYFQVLC